MIRDIYFLDGFPLDLPLIGQRKYTFSDGINLLYGPNGCGKSTIIKTLKGYSAIKTGGWTYPTVPAQTGIGRLNGSDYPHCYSSFTPANCKAMVTWDGTPSFYNDGDCKSSPLAHFFHIQEYQDGITDENDIEKQLKEMPSSGQYRLSKLNKSLSMVKQGAPTYDEKDFGRFPDKSDSHYSLREYGYWKHIKQLYNTHIGPSKPTILLDEPERSLSHVKQKELFFKILPNELKDYQVIIATHSIYSLFTPTANIIEMEHGYIDGLKTAIKEISTYL